MERAHGMGIVVDKQFAVFFCIVASIALVSAARAQTTVVLQQGLNSYAGTSDAKIFLGQTTNVGADMGNDLIVDSSTSLLVRFAVFASEGGPVPDHANIVSATLSHYKPWGPDAVFKANRVLKNWTELGVTWTSTGTGASWTTAGVFSGDILSTSDGQANVAAQPPVQNTVCDVNTGWPDTCWLNIDVTAGVQAFAAGTPNFGWKLSYVSSTSDPSKPKSFYSREVTCCNREIRRPKLTVTYNSPPTAPTASFAASPSTGAAPLTVSFNASATSDGGSPITNLRLQFGDGTADVNWTDKTQVQTHSYSAAGSYTAILTATNAVGTSAPATQTITVATGPGTTPTASFTATPSSGVAPLAVTFDASASADGGSPITSLTLQFGDGQQVTWSTKTTTQSHTYASAGSYAATLTATNSNGTSAPATRTVTVTNGGTCTPSTRAVASAVAVPTFHSMSLYYNPPSAPSGDAIFVRYRRGSDPDVAASWKQGHPLWYDSSAAHPFHGRGSVVHLDPGTQYVFEVSTDNVNWQFVPGMQAEPCPATWSESFPVGTVAAVWSGLKTSTTTSSYLGSRAGNGRNHVLLANQSGTANGYTLYDFTGQNAIAQTSNSSNFFPVVISGSFIILKGLKTVGGESGIFIDPGSHDIVIDGVEVTGYGRDSGTALPPPLSGHRGADEDAGIKFPDSSYGPITDTKRIVIQHSRIHNPAFGANPWDIGHPVGPTAIMMYPTGGQIVIRYNETYSTTDGTFGGPPDLNHYHEDGLVQGGCNSGCTVNGIGPDVDIYKNRVMNYMDDGLEVDGDGTNDRVWRNYFDYGGASAVSTAPTSVGPAYVWRNVYNRQRECIAEDWGNSACNGGGRDPMHKNGGNGVNTGKTYIYHNTSLQPPASSEGFTGFPLGAGGGSGGGALEVSRNNVFEIWKPNWNGFNTTGTDADFDLTNVNCWTGSLPSCTTTEPDGHTSTTPQYQNQNATDGTANGWRSYWNGKYRLVPGTPGYDDGVAIPNFNDGYVGAAPDRGAHEDGTPDMDFGPSASGS